jgi:hypothetical protein
MSCLWLGRRAVSPWMLAAILAVGASAGLSAQGRAGARGGPPGPPPTAQAAAPIDLTGYWVSLVTEDWRWRMVTPAKGDYASVPLNPEGRKVADTWDPAKDTAAGNQCKAYGAAAIMRVPTRLHITWEDDNTLKVETDAGTQIRLFHFGPPKPPSGEAGWQGYSAAEWDVVGGGRGRGAVRPQGGSLKVVTTHMKPGYLRKNGVPYSANAVVTEYLDRTTEPDGNSYLIVTNIVDDPEYLQQPFITSTHFKKEPDASKWHPTPCEAK